MSYDVTNLCPMCAELQTENARLRDFADRMSEPFAVVADSDSALPHNGAAWRRHVAAEEYRSWRGSKA